MSKKINIPGWPEIPKAAMAAFANPLSGGAAAAAMPAGFDFIKNLWGALPTAVPGFVVPTLDLEELDKRITDLKAVESWLAINANLLRATIQSLEVQRNTIATIQSFGGSLTGAADDFMAGRAGSQAAESSVGHANWPNPKPGAPQSANASVPPGVEPAQSRAPRARPQAVRNPQKRGAESAGKTPKSADGPGLTAPSWLGFLQDQFNQVAQAALAGTSASAPSAAPPPPSGGVPRTAAPSRSGARTPVRKSAQKAKA
jgi:hypothetical protein